MKYCDVWSEIQDKLNVFMSSKINVRKQNENIPFYLLSDDTFIKMMISFSDEIKFDINRQNEVRNAVLSSIKDFNPDGIVMHRYVAIFLDNGSEQPPDIVTMRDAYHMECRLFGIRTALFDNYDEFPYNKVLLIRQEESNPVSRLLSFNAI